MQSIPMNRASGGHRPWPYRFLLSILLVLPATAFAQSGNAAEVSDWAIFFGRFHPLIVHLPIGFILIAFLLECASRMKGYRNLGHATAFVLMLGVLSALFAAVAGYLLSLSGGYDEEALFWHQWLGIGVVIIAALAYALKVYPRKKRLATAAKLYLPVFSVAVVLLMAAGHYGGSLTHGSDYLTAYLPPPLRQVAGLPPRENKGPKKIENIQEAVVFTDIIHPILDDQCISCHNPSKKKGDLLLHTQEAILKGGEGGPVLVAGDAGNSELIKRMLLPLNHDDHMPPKGKKQPTKDQIALIRWWIEEGAPFDKKVAELNTSDEMKVMLASLGEGSLEDKGIFAQQVPPASPESIAQVRKAGVQVMSISQDNHFLQAKLLNREDSIRKKPLTLFQPLAEQITWLDLGNAPVSDTTLAGIADLKNLTRLHLEQTFVSDKGLKNLQNLPQLEYLNLYGTAVTDEGIQQLAPLKKLRSLYLWQTKVTPEGARRLQEQIPGLSVNMGVDQQLPAVTKSDTLVRRTALRKE
jgi:uncharacterized membrane protein